MTEPMKFKEVLEQLNTAVETAEKYFAELEPDNVSALLRGFTALKEYDDQLDKAASKLSRLLNQLSYEVIPSTFERLGYDALKIDGKNYVVGVRFNASIPQPKREEGFKWLEEHGLGALIQPSVNAKTLSAALAAYFEEHAELPPPEAVSIFRQPFTSVRKA